MSGFHRRTKELLLRENPWCELCGSEKNLTIHHIIAKNTGGPNIKENGMVLCRKCHDTVHCQLLCANITHKSMQKLKRRYITLTRRRRKYTIKYMLRQRKKDSFDIPF